MPDDFLLQPRSGSSSDVDGHNARFGLDSFLNESLRKKHKVPHLNEIIEYLIDEWGGPRNFAHAFFAEFQRLSPGMIRARMLESVLRLLQTHANISGTPEDLGMISEDDLKAAALSLFDVQEKEAAASGSERSATASQAASEQASGSSDT